MITIISGTNRVKSNSLNVAKSYQKVLKEKGLESQILDLSTLPMTFMQEDMYGARTDRMKKIIAQYLTPVDHLVFTIPEYNGTYPGALKLFVDGLEPKNFHDKSACLVGVATGRAGNIRGLDAFTHVLHHLKVEVFSNKVLLSKVDQLLNKEGYIEDSVALQIIEEQIDTYRKIHNLK